MENCLSAWTLSIIFLTLQVVPWGDDETLYGFLREQDGDVLITGNTNIAKVSTVDKKYIINPGSATGGFTPG